MTERKLEPHVNVDRIYKMKFYCTNCILKFNWDQVTCAFWRRYPNPYSKHVLTEDIVDRYFVENKLYTKKLLTKTSSPPRWAERFVSSKVACIVEESIVDPEARTLTTYTKNITFTRLMMVEEKCVFSIHPTNREWITCRKQSWISSGIFGFSRAIERFGVERYKMNASKAFKGLQTILEKMYVPERPPRPLPLPVPHMS
ncbi:PRELI domain-containing protein 1, mitochondrial-like [Montipora capricornis]|uniref:PRELI domain-containing protein 1, mitochondrial-like n=1 Tax=Montipora capricornis TaxID=246305 RepID=UPI0035F2176F